MPDTEPTSYVLRAEATVHGGTVVVRFEDGVELEVEGKYVEEVVEERRAALAQLLPIPVRMELRWKVVGG